jgi:hypothetical protein
MLVLCKKKLHEYELIEGKKRKCPQCNKDWHKKNPSRENKEYQKLYAREFRKNSNCVQEQNLRKFWPGTTGKEAVQKYNELLMGQDYCCKMCNAHNSNFARALAVDHCHKTGEIRGLLCGPCNTSLGHYEKIKASAEIYLGKKDE